MKMTKYMNQDKISKCRTNLQFLSFYCRFKDIGAFYRACDVAKFRRVLRYILWRCLWTG